MSHQSSSRSPGPSQPKQRVPLAERSPDELRTWIQNMREQLQCKMQRERTYLDRRASRGVHTPTDDVYEADQQLEAELMALIDEMAASLEGREYDAT